MTLAPGLLLLALVASPPAAHEVVGRNGVVAADHPMASKVGVEVLRAGGDAVDAAVATTLALGVLNPQSSGIGGGGFAVVWRAKEGRAYAIDFRETAPAATGPGTFAREGLSAQASRFGGLAVGTPGEVAGLEHLHRRWGRRPWTELVAPAARLAQEGYPCGAALAEVFERYGDQLAPDGSLGALFRRPDGSWPGRGDAIRLPGLGKTLSAIAQGGAEAFYAGSVARSLAAAARDAGGALTEADLKAYRVRDRTPLVGAYRGRSVVTMPPPSSGGVVLLQVLGMLEARKALPSAQGDPERLGVLVEALKHAFADRARWMGDPDFAKVPVDRLLDPEALRTKAASLDPRRTGPPEAYGVIAPPADDAGTSHLSIIDAHGNAVALTTTINTGFGSLVVAGDTGVILNNEMDDFTTRPGEPNAFGLVQSRRNAVEAGKRPLSSMTPTVVLPKLAPGAQPLLVVGASGGPRIITGTLQVVLNVLDHGLSPGRAISAARLHHQWQPNLLRHEAGVAEAAVRSLRGAGHKLDGAPQSFGVVQAAGVADGTKSGASDPRKHGHAQAW